MKRLHVHIAVADLDRSVGFYSALFAAEPTVLEPDYAKWMLDDPRVNFAISTRAEQLGLEHLGIEVDTPDELHEVYGRLKSAGGPVIEEGETVCCYASSEKSWISDPHGIPWEAFLTSGPSTVYGDGIDLGPIRTAGAACCTPATPQGVCCAPKNDRPADAPCCG